MNEPDRSDYICVCKLADGAVVACTLKGYEIAHFKKNGWGFDVPSGTVEIVRQTKLEARK